MVRLTLSASLAVLLPESDQVRTSHTTVQVDASCWNELTEQMRQRFPVLAGRVLNGGSDVSPGFVVVVNDEVTRKPPGDLELSPGDEVYMFAAVAGG
jgi:molybdopterin converting factor small subunit